MQQKILIILCILGFIGLIWLATTSNNSTTAVVSAGESTQSVRVENGVQFIHVLARGGYQPKQVNAKARMPTKLEIETQGTYDCSSAFTIPSLGYKKMLPPMGTTTIDIPSQPVGSSLLALCAMGMYSLDIQFN